MKKVLLTALLLMPLAAFAQYPGGISSNLKMWIKANSGVSLNSGITVAQWNEKSSAGVTGDFATQGSNISMTSPAQNQPGYDPGGINFNPHVVFDQTAVNSISSNNAFVGTALFDQYNNTIFQVIKLHTISNTGVWFKWQYNNTNVNRVGNEVNNGGTNAGKLRFDFRGINNFSQTNINDKYFLAECNTTQAQSIIRLNGANDNVMNYSTQAAFAPATASPARLTLGNEEYGDSYPTTIDIAEVIIYNRQLTAAEINKVESYLAVKYGFTLDQSAANPNNYTSSSSTIIWNRASNLPFINNITGIGRDDGDSLDQRQSRSINATSLVTIFHGSYQGPGFPSLNTINSNNFPADNSYLLFGDNNGTLALNRCYSGNPAFLRMNRSWKVQVTGTVNTVTVAVKKSDMPAFTTHLLVSTDSAFTAANTVAYKLDTAGGFLSKAVQFQNNTYFTFASDSLILRPGSNSPICANSSIQLYAAAPAGTSFTWTGPDNFSSTMQNPVIAGAQLTNSGVYTLNANFNGCAFLPGSVSVVVATMPPPPKVTTPIYYCKNDVALPLEATGVDLTWYRAPIGVNGTTTPPVPVTAQQDTLTWWVTQSNEGCESVRTKQEVIVRNKPVGFIVASQKIVCQGDVDSFYFYGNGLAWDEFNWKTPINSTSIISGSGEGPVVVRFDSAGTFNVRLQINNKGCVSDEMIQPIKVNPRPVSHAVVKSDVCVDEIVNVALRFASPDATNYTWDFDNGKTTYTAYPGGPFGVSWNTPGKKLVTHVTYAKGCPSLSIVDTVTVHGAPEPRIQATIPFRLCMGDSLVLATEAIDTADSYKWMPAQYFDGKSEATTTGVIQHTGHVGVQVTDRYGCVGSDSILVNTESCCQVSLPTAFSPNGDGRNDRFHIITVGHHKVTNFRVVNRWGQTVWETVDERNSWDGTFNGIPQDIGTYYYYLKYRCEEGKPHDIEERGEVVLVR
jgi:gliding motility-associated-like protein